MTGVYANGIPKSGTHALTKTIQLLGVACELSHSPYASKPDGKTVCTFRNPRNILVSWLRFTGQPVTQGMLIEQMQTFEGEGIAAAGAKYTPYLTDPAVLCVHYEELWQDGGATVAQIASFLGVPVLDDCYDNIPGLTVSWTGSPSQWQDHWTDIVDAAWKEHGGEELEAAWS
jgi:hypothetical protein